MLIPGQAMDNPSSHQASWDAVDTKDVDLARHCERLKSCVVPKDQSRSCIHQYTKTAVDLTRRPAQENLAAGKRGMSSLHVQFEEVRIHSTDLEPH